jgi:hypothetical protein
MTNHTIVYLVIAAIFLFGVVWPSAIVFRRTGQSPWWCLFGLLALIGLPILFWTLALRPWPNVDARLPLQD